MTKAEKKMLNVAKGAAKGAACGTAVMAYWAGSALIAPVAYPVSNVLMGVAQGKARNCDALETAALAVAGGVLGVLLIPAAPINFLFSPVAIPLGAAIGGLVAHVENQKEDK